MLAPVTQESPPPPGFEPGVAWRDRSIEIGLLATLFFHVLLFWLAPQFPVERFTGNGRGLNVKPRGRDFDIQLAPADIAPPQKNPFKYVETNPDAPENIPDKTDNFSSRNQQAAQPVPDKASKDRTPSTKGRDDIKNDTQIVTGDMARPQTGATVTPSQSQTDQAQQNQQQARQEQVPLSGFEKTEGKSDEGVGSNISQNKNPSTNAPELAEGARDARNPDGSLVTTKQNTHAQPQARPRLTQAPPALLQNRVRGAPDAGIIGFDARWNEFGQYLNEMSEIVRTQWYVLLEDRQSMPAAHTYAVITFRLKSNGDTEIIKVDEETCGKVGVWNCITAIQKPQPYRHWSKEMIGVLGEEQTLTFKFYYYW